MENASRLKILYEDNHVLVVFKPAGMLSQGDLSGDLDLLTVAKQMIKARDSKPGNVYIGLVHRLDRPVGGVMLLAKTSKAASRLSEQFRKRETDKLYRAVVRGTPRQRKAELVDLLEKDRETRITRVVKRGGKRAVSSYQVLESRGRRCLLQVRLETGLPHQIRAQLSHLGHPILGDRKYGSDEYLKKGPGIIALYASSITFSHPVSKEMVTVTTEAPLWWPW